MAASAAFAQASLSCISTAKGTNSLSTSLSATHSLKRVNSPKIQVVLLVPKTAEWKSKSFATSPIRLLNQFWPTNRNDLDSPALQAPLHQATPLQSISVRNANHWRKSNTLTVYATVQQLTGSITKPEGLRFVVVAARFNDIITKPLVEGALEAFRRHSVREEDIDVIWVPGSFEIPLVAQTVAKSGKYHAVICIGAVVRGDTTHYEAVANSASSGVLSAALNSGHYMESSSFGEYYMTPQCSGVPCIFGVLTCDTMEQAMDRAGGKAGNKGAEAAVTAIEMASLFQHHLKL